MPIARSCFAATTVTAGWQVFLFRARRGRTFTPSMLSIMRPLACGKPSPSLCWAKSGSNGGGTRSKERQPDAKANPVASALLDTIARFNLPKAPLHELIGARLADLYGDPMVSAAALESYTEATCASLFCLASLILEGEETAPDLGAASHAGIAYGVTGLLRALPWHCARGQIFVPAEILRAHGAETGDLTAGRASPAIRAALADLCALARAHLDIFDARLHSLPDKSRPAFLSVCLCEPYLRLMEKPGYDPFKTVIELPQWRRQWILWSASNRWG